MSKKIKTASDARAFFLTRAKEILKDTFYISKKAESMTQAQKMQYETLSKIIEQASDVQQIDARSTQSIFKALANGKITADEAIKLINMLRQHEEIQTLKKGQKFMTKMGKNKI